MALDSFLFTNDVSKRLGGPPPRCGVTFSGVLKRIPNSSVTLLNGVPACKNLVL